LQNLAKLNKEFYLIILDEMILIESGCKTQYIRLWSCF